LHRATRFAALQLLRTERRRFKREQEAVLMNITDSACPPDWEHIRPLLDEALDRMGREDRDALLLRFFEQRSLQEVGAALGINEDAARKRVSRALEKLRAILSRRGATVTVTALAASITAGAVQSAPAGLALTLTQGALTAAAVGGGAAFAIFHTMSLAKFTALAAGIAVTGGLATTLVLQQSVDKLRAENKTLDLQVQGMQQVTDENRELKKVATDAAELERLRGERNELLRLRGDVTQLRGQLAEARATVARAETNSRLRFTIKGEVRNPGEFRWTNGMRLADAIETAGGFTSRADPAQVALLPATNRTLLTIYNTSGKSREAGPLVQPGDMITVRTLGSPPILASTNTGTSFPRESWDFAGYATPEATVQSYIWAASQGKAESVLACLDPDSDIAKKIKAEFQAHPESLAKAPEQSQNVREFRILSSEILSGDEVRLTATMTIKGVEGPPDKLHLRKINGDWKLSGMD
jgi:hypothetical protein